MRIETTYEMPVDLNVLNHLGISLYSNTPAVLAEAVANAWDADAETVEVEFSDDFATIKILDDGHGMSQGDINTKFLKVGYRRREQGDPVTPKHRRDVMGRKGIGKLSLFSIADTIEVQTAVNGSANGFTMSLGDIKQAVQDGTSNGTYYPTPLQHDKLVVKNGTQIVLTNLRRRLTHTKPALQRLRRRLARRFSVIDPANQFSVSVNGKPIDVSDRDYYKSLQYVWHYGEMGRRCSLLCKNVEHSEQRPCNTIKGWIGTTFQSGQLRDESLNKVVVMVRGKVAKEDILADLDETGLYPKFLIGEIHADFLDDNEKDDIATTGRQAIIEDDERYVMLKETVRAELNHIRAQWTGFRNDGGTKEAVQIEAVRNWFLDLSPDNKKRAKAVFGKLNQIPVDDPVQRTMLFKYGVLAFESLTSKQNLDEISNASGESTVDFGRVFGTLDDLESSLYNQIVSGRIDVVRALQCQVDEDEKERTIQEHLSNHLWLLDPSWERATATESMERSVGREFARINDSLSMEERASRIDIKYQTNAGKHVIVELKRPSVSTTTLSILNQIEKYISALEKVLREREEHPHIEVLCVVGREPSDWSSPGGREESAQKLKPWGARVLLYNELIDSAFRAYQDFINKSEEAGRIVRLLRVIDESLDE